MDAIYEVNYYKMPLWKCIICKPACHLFRPGAKLEPDPDAVPSAERSTRRRSARTTSPSRPAATDSAMHRLRPDLDLQTILRPSLK